ncbi:MAG: putative glycosyltransferase [Friedmanniella sp.]|nr:putative glycosyltransferase [Friedmanniella sp.]
MSRSGLGEPAGSSDAPVSFEHLFRLSDDGGLYEHAELSTPRPEHGYCVDDIARGLIVAAREPGRSPELTDLAEFYLWLVVEAQTEDGRFHNRRDLTLHWTDEPTLEDCWGRALWGLGTAAARLDPGSEAARTALRHFEIGAARRAPWLMAMAYAALGAAEVLTRYPEHEVARSLLRDAAHAIAVRTRLHPDRRSGGASGRPGWPWPEPRLRYSNASLPEVLVAAGEWLDEPELRADGLALLGWLLDVETRGEHISVTPVGGWVHGEPRPGFDQQPIEVSSLADACARAYALTGDPRWRTAVLRCEAWFHGANDAATSLVDPDTGGGCDGLHRHGRNENQGAESTMAMISTFQHARRLGSAR